MSEISRANNSADTVIQIGVITLGEFLSDPQIGKKISAQTACKKLWRRLAWLMKPGWISSV